MKICLGKNITIFFDGDAAGLKASFRSIDMILAEGMNVKVVLFPDGEDPDSFAQKCSEEELINYLKENRKEFITFKPFLHVSSSLFLVSHTSVHNTGFSKHIYIILLKLISVKFLT